MAQHIGMKDFGNLRKLARMQDASVSFDYTDRNGKSTRVEGARVDTSTVSDDSMLVRGEGGQFRRYRFDGLRSDVSWENPAAGR